MRRWIRFQSAVWISATLVLSVSFTAAQNKEEPPLTAEWLLSLKTRSASAVVWHLSHSGFALKTSSHMLVFDYVPIRPDTGKGLMAGDIDPREIKDQNVVVFISHEHGDHFFPGCITWKETIKSIRYVVSSDVARKNGDFSEQKGLVTVMDPDREAEIDGLTVKTVPSTDLGVGFLVKTDGLTIWHAGDTAAWGGKVTEFLDRNLKGIKGEEIDIACQPGEAGFVEFAEAIKPKLLIPMHFFGQYAAAAKLQAALAERRSLVQMWKVEKPGEWILYKNGKMIHPRDLKDR